MYGAMGSGGGNAWMKIMGIDQDKIKNRQVGKEKAEKEKIAAEKRFGVGGGVNGDSTDILG